MSLGSKPHASLSIINTDLILRTNIVLCIHIGKLILFISWHVHCICTRIQ